jgi:uncharacterized membrane protein YeaQ/YmgE (transglycosylase-associated protein family)
MVNVVVWIVVGGIIGLLGSLVLRTEAQSQAMTNVLVAVGGALTAELALAPLFRASSQRGDFGLPALVGAIALLTVFSGVRGLAQRYSQYLD